MVRDAKGSFSYWDKSVDFYIADISRMYLRVKEPMANSSYGPQYAYELAKNYWQLMFCRYSRGDAVRELAQYFNPLLDAWEEAERLGKAVWTSEQRFTRHTWAVNFDHYIVCFWLVGLALALEISDEQWNRLLTLIGNEGGDILLDRIIATRSPTRRIGKELCFKKPYARLLAAIDAPVDQQSRKLLEFVEHWYEEMAFIGKSGHEKQAAPYSYPYWYKLGNENFEGGAYFGRWCVEAVTAVKAFGLDDSLCIRHPNYPGDLLHLSESALETASGSIGTASVASSDNMKRSGWLKRFFGGK